MTLALDEEKSHEADSVSRREDVASAEDTPNNAIGGIGESARNIISGNEAQGVHIKGPNAKGNRVQGNFIGTDRDGTVALGNTGTVDRPRFFRNCQGGPFAGLNIGGVLISDGASENTIGGFLTQPPGGPRVALGNVISGNPRGVIIIGSDTNGRLTGTKGNQVVGNLIGLDKNGTQRLSNTFEGIEILDSADNIIGGTVEAFRNVISGNFLAVQLELGVLPPVAGQGENNRVVGNFIGTDISGLRAVGNAAGVTIRCASNNRVGDVVAAGANPGTPPGNVIARAILA